MQVRIRKTVLDLELLCRGFRRGLRGAVDFGMGV